MQLPENALQHQPAPQPNANQNIYVTSNPAFVNLMSIMVRMDPLFEEFQRLHIEAAAARHTTHNAFFAPDLHVVNESAGFVTGYFGIVGILQNIDMSNIESLQHSKFRMTDSIHMCESTFAKFNQNFHAASAIFQVIANMSIVFTDVKRELNRLGLYDMPHFNLSQDTPNANPHVQSRGRDEEGAGPKEERSAVRKRMQ